VKSATFRKPDLVARERGEQMSEGQQGRLAGKVAIVTGAGTSGEVTGTGQAMSTLFARHGAAVVLLDRVAANAPTSRSARRRAPQPWRASAASTSW
jgi:NAD(P)-dependent dehydrogenase (short-subunit alcohol dehydrogenase family)